MSGSEGRSRFRVLYVCAGNVCRSVLAEAITRRVDPRPTRKEYQVCAARIAAALAPTLDALCPEPMPARAPRPADLALPLP